MIKSYSNLKGGGSGGSHKSSDSAKRPEMATKIYANRYRSVKRLGSGKYGVAILVEDLTLNNKPSEERMKVLKEVRVDDHIDPDETLDAVHEANLLRRLNHPFVVKFSDSFLDECNFCIVTEFCEGGDLDQVIEKQKKENATLSESCVLRWTVQLILGVNYIHSQRVLHRDLKSRNVFLKQGNVKIGDFGISRVLHDTTDMASSFLGTPYYMSPEVLKHTEYNSKADVWSIGCILFELCALHRAFEGSGLMGIMVKILDEPCPQLPRQYSDGLQDLLERILVKDPKERPSTKELLDFPIINAFLHSYKEEFDIVSSPTSLGSNKKSPTGSNRSPPFSPPVRPSFDVDKYSGKVNFEDEDDTIKLTPHQMLEKKREQETERKRRELTEATIQTKVETERLKQMNREKTFAPSAMNPLIRPSNRTRVHGHSMSCLPWTSQEYPDYERTTPRSHSSEADQLPSPLSRSFSGTSHHHSHNSHWQARVPLRDLDTLGEEDTLETHGNMRRSARDDRSIKPMLNTTVYDVHRSADDFKDAIFESPDLTEQYYFTETFDDEESTSDREDGNAVRVMRAPTKRSTKSSSKTTSHAKAQTVHKKGKSTNKNAKGESVISASQSKQDRIVRLREQCEAQYGEAKFQGLYKRMQTELKSKPNDFKKVSNAMISSGESPNHVQKVEELLALEMGLLPV